eukprot:14363789-Ditylum_brightwellii.AAC.1
MAKVVQDGLESIAGAAFTRLIYVQGSEQVKIFFDTCVPIVKPQNFLMLRLVGHNINVCGVHLSWKTLPVSSKILRHAG